MFLERLERLLYTPSANADTPSEAQKKAHLAKMLRSGGAVAYAVLYNCLLTFPDLGLFQLEAKPASPDAHYRNGMCRRMTSHGHKVFEGLCELLQVQIDMQAPAGIESLHGTPLVVIANHQSIMDIPLLFYVMERLGLSYTRWIMKQEIGRTPFGWFSRQVESAFVTRKGGKQDIHAVERCARYANEDGAAIVLFPEGTRFTATIEGSGYKQVRPPKKAGFDILRQHMPTAHIISVTLSWTGGDDGSRHGGRTLFDGDRFVGKSVHIRVEAFSHEQVQDPNWLENHWHEKDRQVAQLT